MDFKKIENLVFKTFVKFLENFLDFLKKFKILEKLNFKTNYQTNNFFKKNKKKI